MRRIATALAGGLLALMLAPLIVLIMSLTPAGIAAAASSPRVMDAALLSLWTTSLSLVFVLAGGLPLAWWLARASHRAAGPLRACVELGVVLPPAVVGVALLLLFGRAGLLAPLWARLEWSPAFSPTAVILAQVVVAAPFFVRSATAAFESVPGDLLDVSRTLGASAQSTFLRVALPLAAPGVLAGAALAWARALGEFGATLLFAGSFVGSTQTLPLAIFEALQNDLAVATALSVLLVGLAVLVLAALRLLERAARGMT